MPVPPPLEIKPEISLADVISSLIALASIVIAIGSSYLAYRAARRDTSVQIAEARRAAEASHLAQQMTTYQSAADLMLQVGRVFIEHPEVRRFFYDETAAEQEADGATASLLEPIGEFMLDAMECIWDQRATFSDTDLRSWGRYIKEMLHNSACLRRILRQNPHWYPTIDGLLLGIGDFNKGLGVGLAQLRGWQFAHLLEPHQIPANTRICAKCEELKLQI